MSNISIEESAQRVSSKYFTCKLAMDESLSDFKEPKKIAGPKNTKKTKADKPKKAPKKIRGQKDIRTSLQSKKNELQLYSKDFDHVCKQAGLDVDSEQLQLAIALSKSLQESALNSNDKPETSQSLSSQERVKKIRSTLLEYGFKVPNIKITTASRRLKKRKNYKLLLTSEDAKKQIIVDKYTQVLFENITPSISQNSDADVTHIQLYNLATNATYSKLRSIDTFYVDGLLEKSTSTGNLLRDWSKIPGRPVSPMLCEPTNMNFSEIECSQDELDIVLSGSLKSCKNVIKCKQKEACVKNISEQKKLVITNNLNNSEIVLLDDESSKSNDAGDILKNKEIEIMDPEELKPVNKALKRNGSQTIDTVKNIATVNECRSCSPDLFDDEPSIVIDKTTKLFSQENESTLHLKHSIVVSPSNYVMDLTECDQDRNLKERHSIYPNSQLSQNTNVAKKLNDFMEITECVEVQCPITSSTNSTLKQSQNVTKRKSNDFMDITNCVVSPVRPSPIEGNVDLTQSPENKNSTDVSEANIVVKHKLNVDTSNEITSHNFVEAYQTNIDINVKNRIENIPLCSEEIPGVIFVEKENHIDLTKNPEQVKKYNVEDSMADQTIESMDLTQSSTTSDELPFVSLKANKKGHSPDDTIIMDPKDLERMVKSIVQDNDKIQGLTKNTMHEVINHGSQESQNSKIDCTENEQIPGDILDLTQDVVITSRHNKKTSDTNIIFFDDYVHNHSDDSNMHKEVTCNGNFHKGSDLKEILRSDVGRDTSSKSIESPDLVASQSQNRESNQSDDIDLTQNSEPKKFNQDIRNKDSIQNFSLDVENESESACSDEIDIVKFSQRCSSLGKKDDVSIDYDDLENQYFYSQQSQSSSMSAADNNISNALNISNCSQASEIFVISDHELDYSMHQSKLDKPVNNFIFGGISIMDELSGFASFSRSTNIKNISATANKNVVAAAENYERDSTHIEIEHIRNTPVKHKRLGELATPQKSSCSGINTVVTPSNSQYVIKTTDVTPMPKYENMSLQELHNELDSFGVKPFKRKRAIQLLTHIYNQTHPTFESDDESPCKRRKTNDYDSPRKPSPRKLTPRKILSPKKTVKSPRKVAKQVKANTKEKVSEESNTRLNNREVIQIISENYEVNETPVIKEVECSPNDWVFQKREKAKVHSCRVPLHIAFYNYVSSRRELREAILCYEPINIDDIHKNLVAYGHRYDPKELLKFMDKKCITVKTTDNDARNQKK